MSVFWDFNPEAKHTRFKLDEKIQYNKDLDLAPDMDTVFCQSWKGGKPECPEKNPPDL